MTTGTKRARASRTAARDGGVSRERRFAVVMAGGSGTRFWPWSRESFPKQLLALSSDRSMLAETVSRLDGIVPASQIYVVTSRRYRRQVLAQVPSLVPGNVLGEPEGRNTAACIGWAALEIRRRCADAVMAVFSADHRIGDVRAFRRDVARGFAVADTTRRLVTFGVAPAYPATGYGYIRAGQKLAGEGGAHEVAAFVEKPDAATAKRYVAGGRHFWNSGIFVWRADVIAEELAAHLPALAHGLEKMAGRRTRGGIPASVVAREYPRLQSISIDHGILERSRRVAMLPVSFPWADIGAWDAAGVLWPADRDGNASRDPLLAIDSAANVVATRGKPTVLLGVQGLVVVDAGDALLVCTRERAQDVRMAVARLDAAGLGGLR